MKTPCPRCQGTGTIEAKDPEEAKKERLIVLAKRWHDRYGEPPSVRAWKSVRGTEWPSYQTCVRAFGTWDNFIAACGWEPRGRGRPVK